jgi:site-specific recombinase XerD
MMKKKMRGVFEKVPGSDIWWIQYFAADGKRHREKIGTKANALKLVELRRTQRLVGRKLPKPRSRPLLFSELTAAALAYTVGRAGHPANQSRMSKLIEEFGNSVAEEITPEQVETWLANRKEWSLATKNRFIALLKLVFRLAERAKKIKYNPARFVRQQKENNARIRWLSDREETALRAVIRRDYPGHMPEFDVALYTGMRRSEQYGRRSEQYGMQWEAVDLQNRIITVPKSKHGEVRYVQMNSRVAVILSALKDASFGMGSVFSLRSPRCWFDPAVKAARIKDFSWHCLRHTFISRLVMAGVDLRTVQELAGHKSIAMTCRYAHLAPGHQQAAVEKLLAEPSATRTATEGSEGTDGSRQVLQ